MAERTKTRQTLLAPKHRGRIPREKIAKAIKKIVAERRKLQVAGSDGSK